MSASPVETEIKLQVADSAAARKLLEQHGFKIKAARVFEANNVYDTPSGDIRSRGELLRLRKTADRSTLTFKGVAREGRHKSRPEFEVLVSDFESCDAILRQLGYVVRFRYEKYRTEYSIPHEPGTATIDETPIGCYVELEGDTGWIDATATTLGFSEKDYINKSYGSLYLDHCYSSGIPVTNMVFESLDGEQ